MLLTEIKHEALTNPTDWSDDVLQIASAAQDTLGYSLLADMQSTTSKTKPLAAVLGQLGIEVLNQEDVFKYQVERMVEVTKVEFQKWLSEKAAKEPNQYDPHWGFSGVSWRETPIDEYKEPVPEFVLNKAIQIKKACPSACIMIEHLARDPFLVVGIRQDPNNKYSSFVEKLYVEVWEEPKFEGRLR